MKSLASVHKEERTYQSSKKNLRIRLLSIEDMEEPQFFLTDERGMLVMSSW